MPDHYDSPAFLPPLVYRGKHWSFRNRSGRSIFHSMIGLPGLTVAGQMEMSGWKENLCFSGSVLTEGLIWLPRIELNTIWDARRKGFSLFGLSGLTMRWYVRS
ncbi:hypothetical protein TNCV_2128731 [Trichonephila clavipes]|nr:hypothetical protein TNCV_2128731 [Trichonephila clavipes]